MRVAAIDCGTNSVRLLVADADGRGLTDVERRLHLTRLGQGVDASGQFHPDALARTLAAVADFAGQIAELGVQRVRMVATSAARDATNRDEFFAGVRERLGVEAEIISGEEEARLSFLGAVTAVAFEPPALVMDIGGGSTELVRGRLDASGQVQIEQGISLDVGSVRFRERFLASDPPTAAEVGRAQAHLGSLLDECGIDFAGIGSWIGVGGTVTSLSALHQRLPEYQRAKVHGSVLPRSGLSELTAALLASSVAQVRTLPSMHPQRADVICAGALIADAVAARVGRDLVVSESDILDGIALGLLS
ncbi:MAG: Ppx/GppA phosphatase family protein [Micropruina sp.]